jgi:hypothetical protein
MLEGTEMSIITSRDEGLGIAFNPIDELIRFLVSMVRYKKELKINA